MKFVTPGVFRFLLAFIVVIHHNVSFLHIGHAAVYVFFILSGYWIIKMYEEKYQYFKNSYKVFIVSRLLRLMPLYYLIFVVSFILSIYLQGLLSNTEIHSYSIILSNLFLIGLSNAQYAVLLPGWSLDIELQFYLLAPVISFVLAKINKIFFLIISIVLSIGYFIIVGEHFFWLLSYFSFFVVGMYIYIYDFKSNKFFSYAMLYIALMIFVIYHDMVVFNKIISSSSECRDFLFNNMEIFNVVLAILMIPYVTINIRIPVLGKYDKIFASMSYIIYLLHWPAIKIYSS